MHPVGQIHHDFERDTFAINRPVCICQLRSVVPAPKFWLGLRIKNHPGCEAQGAKTFDALQKKGVEDLCGVVCFKNFPAPPWAIRHKNTDITYVIAGFCGNDLEIEKVVLGRHYLYHITARL
jgi:hypothetical protein